MKNSHAAISFRTILVLGLMVALLIPSVPSVAVAATSGGWTTVAKVSSEALAPGEKIDITASVTATKRQSALVDIEVYSAGGLKVHQRSWDNQSFQAGSARSFSTSWTVPEGAEHGVYSVKIGIFATGWTALRHWNDGAAAFEVVKPLPVNGGTDASDWHAAATSSAASVSPGASLEIATTVLPQENAIALIDVEVYNAQGVKTFQRVWDDQVFEAGSARTFKGTWNVPVDAAEGPHVVRVGIFAAGWQALRYWNNDAGGFEVRAASGTTPEPTPAPTDEPTPAPTPEPTPTADLPLRPAGWSSRLELGWMSSPGDASRVKATAPFGYRYQYLAGGANTGNGWASWNANGTFVTNYINESRNAGMIPAFTYYMLYQSKPGVDMGEAQGIQANLTNASTMGAYYGDLKLFFQRAGEAGGPIVFHVEPDLWAFMQQRATNDDASSVPVIVGGTGLDITAGLPDTAAGFAQAILRLRNTYATNVTLGYHFSTWGTGNDFIYSDPSDSTVETLGRRTAAFYKSLGTDFDVAFTDIADRDAAFKQYVYRDNGASWFNANDYHRSTVFIGSFVRSSGVRAVLWQIPLGNTKMRAMDNTWGHYQDNKVEWLLDEPARTHLQAYVDAGVIGLFFGQGAGGATCACDAIGDGVTNPTAINGNALQSLSADDDGGFFRDRAAAYYATGAVPLWK